MKLGIIGLPQSGRSTIFEALTRNLAPLVSAGQPRIGTVHVPDSRLDALSSMYQPKKTTYAQVEYFLPGQIDQSQTAAKDTPTWNLVRTSDALIHVLRNFRGYGFGPPSPLKDFMQLDQELIFADLVVAEKRMERLELDQKRGKKINPQELALAEQRLDLDELALHVIELAAEIAARVHLEITLFLQRSRHRALEL